jgi:aspartyl-tRNA(Asn)/glutamyl-tRNA(Gln) amidotransferase subunit B
MFNEGKDPEDIAKERGLIIENDIEAVQKAIAEVIAENPKAVEQYKSGIEKVFGFLMGQTARKVGKSASPSIIREYLIKALQD